MSSGTRASIGVVTQQEDVGRDDLSAKGNWVITAARISPIIGADGEAREKLDKRIAEMRGDQRELVEQRPGDQARAAALMYCGTSNQRSANSAPPMMTTATATIARMSVADLCPGRWRRPTGW